MIKRLLDLAITLPALILLAPLMILLALAVRLDSSGPVFFRQARIGKGGLPFDIYKFRSMRERPGNPGRSITVEGDSRVTRSGAWLRRSKLDELPQLLNVAKGQMSLVGPRPEVPEYVALYPARVRSVVLSVRPGLTDLASVKYRDESRLLALAAAPENYYVNKLMPRKLALCRYYVRHQSTILDFRILMATLCALVGGPAGRAGRAGSAERGHVERN